MLERSIRPASPHILTLVAVTAVAPLSMNVFLPSLPGMARYFDAPYSTVQLTVSLYLFTIAIFQLLIGPASDRFGRRPVTLVCLTLFLLGTLGALFSPTIEVLLAFRLVQAFSAGGLVVARAVVRDTVGPDETASRMGYITMGMALVPMLAPMVGGVLDEAFGWQATFVFAFLLGAVALAVAYFDLTETNLNLSGSFRSQLRNYPSLLRSQSFWGYTLTAAFASGAFFAFIGGGPFVASEILGMSPFAYGLYFGLLSIGYLFGNFLSARYATAVGLTRMMAAGTIMTAFGSALAIPLFMAGLVYPLTLFGSITFVGLGNGMTLPSALAGMVSARPELAGTASGLGGAFQLAFGGLLSVLAGSLLSAEAGPYPLLYTMLASSLLGVASAFWVMHRKGLA